MPSASLRERCPVTAPRATFRRDWTRYGVDAWRHRTWTAFYAQRTERDGVNAWEVYHMRDHRRGCPGPFDTLAAADNWIVNNANREYDR